MNIFEKLNLKPEEENLIKKTIFISGCLFVLLLILFGTINFIEMKKISSRTKAKTESKTVTEIDLRTFYEKNSDKILPIDLEAHKKAASTRGDTSIKDRIHHLTRIVAAEPDNFEMHLKLAEAYLEAGQFKKAEDLFKQISITSKEKTKKLPCRINAMHGLVLFYNGKIKEGHQKLSELVYSGQSCSEAYCYLGQIEAALNRTENQAEKYLKKSIELDNKNSEAAYQLARFYMNHPNVDSTHYRLARNLLLEIIEGEPLNYRAHSRLGMAYYYLDQPSLAEKSYLTSLNLFSYDYNTRFNLGELYYIVFKESKKALLQYKLALESNPNHVGANFKSGIIMIENGQYKEAVNFLKLASKHDTRNVRILLQLAVAYEKLDLKQEAYETYKKVLILDKLNDVALMKKRLLKDALQS